MDVIRYLIHFGVDTGMAEDIAQDVFMLAIRQPAERAPSENLFGWLLTSARNLAINQFRRNRRENLVSPEVWQHFERTICSSAEPIDGRISKLQREKQLIRLLQSLHATERKCLILRSKGLTFREMGELLDLPLRTVAGVTARAIQKLRIRLDASTL